MSTSDNQHTQVAMGTQTRELPAPVTGCLRELVQAAEDISRFPTVYITLFNNDVATILSSVNFPFKSIQLNNLPDELLREHNKQLIVKDLEADPRLEVRHKRLKWFLGRTWLSRGISVKSDDKPIGSVAFASPQSVELRARSRVLLETAAGIAGEALTGDHVPDDPRSMLLDRMFTRLDREESADGVRGQKFYEDLFEKSGDGIFILKEGEFINCNKKATELFGCSKETLLKKTPMFFSPEYQPDGQRSQEKSRILLQSSLEGDQREFEWKHRRADGSTFLANVQLSPIEHEDDTYVQIVLRDITEQKKLRSQLERSRSLFRETLEGTPAGILVVSNGGNIIYFNKKLTRLWNVSQEQLKNAKFNDFVEMVSNEVKQPEHLRKSNKSQSDGNTSKTKDVLQLTDGRVFNRTITSMTSDNQIIGTLLTFRDITEQRQQRRLIEDFADFYRKNPEPVFQINDEGHLQRANQAAQPLLNQWHCEVGDPLPKEIRGYAEKARKEQTRVTCDVHCGQRIYSLVFTPISNEHIVNVYGRNVTERKRAEDTLRQKKEEYESLAEACPDIVYRIDPEGRFEYISSDVDRLGFEPEELLGCHYSKLVHPEDVKKASREHVLPEYRGTETGPEDAPDLFDERRTGERSTRGLEISLLSRHNKNRENVYEVNSSGLYSADSKQPDSEFLGTVGIIRDITNRKQTEERLKEVREELEELSYKDQLTDLRNRRYFDDVFEKEWNRHRREQDRICLFMADIDFFKIYNDTYGHPRGDRCLEIIGNVFRETLNRRSDVIARYGGEEFIGFLPETGARGGQVVGESIREAVVDREITFPHSPVNEVLTISVGVAACIPETDDYEKLIEHADEALYQAKDQGRNRTVVYNEDLS